jgi:hypothetical protein
MSPFPNDFEALIDVKGWNIRENIDQEISEVMTLHLLKNIVDVETSGGEFVRTFVANCSWVQKITLVLAIDSFIISVVYYDCYVGAGKPCGSFDSPLIETWRKSGLENGLSPFCKQD